MDVFLANEQDVPVDERRLSALARHTLNSEDLDEDCELSLLFVVADHMRRLNRRFAGNDYATDVLAFPMMDDDNGFLLLGDVVVCPSVAQQNAGQAGHSLSDELDALVVHGTLHLLGYDHQRPEEKSRMEDRAIEVLETFRASSVQ
ncbi:MAG TPA: rRNA maturation RNase YbeY [Actinomycetota bacterium]|nr:rRNA maturation RNase YbeY [Actinomycetota bacterium]